MSVRTVNVVTRAGLSEASLFSAADVGGDLVPNDGRTWVEFINTGGSPVTVTEKALIDGVTVDARTFVVPATTGRFKVGPFPPSWNNTSNQMSFAYSGVTGLTIAAFTF